MADTKRTQTAVLALLADNVTGDISPQDLRDSVVSARANQGGAWAYYADGTSTTQGTAQVVLADARDQMLNDGVGRTEIGQIQDMAAPWVNDKLVVELDCTYQVRLTFNAQISSGAGGEHLTVDMDIGGAIGVIWAGTETLAKGANEPHSYTFSIPSFAGTTFVANGGQLNITPSVDMDIWNVAVFVVRTYMPDN